MLCSTRCTCYRYDEIAIKRFLFMLYNIRPNIRSDSVHVMSNFSVNVGKCATASGTKRNNAHKKRRFWNVGFLKRSSIRTGANGQKFRGGAEKSIISVVQDLYLQRQLRTRKHNQMLIYGTSYTHFSFLRKKISEMPTDIIKLVEISRKHKKRFFSLREPIVF